MANCMVNAIVLKDWLEKTGRFEILSKDTGVPFVVFTLKDASGYSVFDIVDHLRRFSWIVPAYKMLANAEKVAVLRVVVRVDFSRNLAERLVNDIVKVLEELDAHPVHIVTKVAHVIVDKEGVEDGKAPHKTVDETELREITTHWRKLVDRKKTKGVY